MGSFELQSSLIENRAEHVTSKISTSKSTLTQNPAIATTTSIECRRFSAFVQPKESKRGVNESIQQQRMNNNLKKKRAGYFILLVF